MHNTFAKYVKFPKKDESTIISPWTKRCCRVPPPPWRPGEREKWQSSTWICGHSRRSNVPTKETQDQTRYLHQSHERRGILANRCSYRQACGCDPTPYQRFPFPPCSGLGRNCWRHLGFNCSVFLWVAKESKNEILQRKKFVRFHS